MKQMRVTCHDGLFRLEAIPFRIAAARAAEKLNIAGDGEDFESLERLIAEAEAAGAPRAAYRVSYLDERHDEEVIIDRQRFRSRVLSVNLEKAHRVFPYVVTCGPELEDWSKRQSDPLFAYFADYIKQAALAASRKFAFGYIKETYRLSKFSTMAPGSLADWPIQEQRPLFDLLGPVRETTGVVLTESFLMLPTKSVSGILFPTGSSFASCMLCPREHCVGRSAPYDEKLYAEKYRKQAG
ncbi:MAG TPA: vitamin B12 dependent-methionine synthase activation domain-containing protein [bacterium]|nr:vitamin B12 dependent-methionine synthase activation domain-containing protein [bacterium]HNS48269.1 vitamin B12 dependent-methionine synthase activation domain-containing protein [bacterium]